MEEQKAIAVGLKSYCTYCDDDTTSVTGNDDFEYCANCGNIK